MPPIVQVRDLTKTYKGGFTALSGVSIDIEQGEIIALLGPNGAGKTTLISTICGITTPSGGSVEVGGHDVVRDWRRARDMIGLVPQEIALEPFSTVWNNVRLTRGLYDRPRDDAHLERLLRDLSLWEKRDAKVMELSGGMKRRVLIAKALSHGPRVLFLDEPTAGVDVELRRDMWRVVARLREEGVTIILTTHYIEEAEAIADRIGVISKGRIMLVERTAELMARLGRKELRVELAEPLAEIPGSLARDGLSRADDGSALIYSYDTRAPRTGITALLSDIQSAGLQLTDLSTSASSLEEIFVGLVKEDAA